ncbi:MAG: 1-acyl-sn-glycerol-3-phosphate acyltransferase [Clostridia bacterium]|nr:1-acyl-sn-glycerol-3-phosphate acyltransferase [Clostridia bacterium]
MKIKTKQMTFAEVMALPRPKHRKPKRPNVFFRTLLKLVSLPDLWATRFRVKRIGMERLARGECCLYLMNHCSFIDLEIAASVLYPRPFNIVATFDGFIGKAWLMRNLGCIPTQKFVNDVGLVMDILYAVRKKKNSVLMYPEAGYSLDGTTTTLPSHLGRFVKKLGIPVVMIRTNGAFLRDPLYNNLQRRKVRVSAEIEYLLSPDEITAMTEEALYQKIVEEFRIDYFRRQKEAEIKVDAPFRADYLNRVLYKCPHCMTEGKTRGQGTKITCEACGATYTLTEYGELVCENGETKFSFATDWYTWERACVREEIREGRYCLDVPVKIALQVDYKALYFVGEGRLIHTRDGFALTGCDGALSYTQKPVATYSLCADYNFYEIGDVICIGDNKTRYYCFPQTEDDVVTKARLATEEIYKML